MTHLDGGDGKTTIPDPPDPIGTATVWLRHHMPTGGIRPYIPWLAFGGFMLLAWMFWLLMRGQNASAWQVARWSKDTQRNDGVASARAIRKVASRRAMRRRATVLKPSLRQMSAWQRFRTSTLEYATPLARVGSQRIWSPIEDVTLRVGGPRTGKTGELAGRILDAPGAVIVTSTRIDVIKLTAACRTKKGPVFVFNPAGFAGHPTSIFFDPVFGCTDVNVASYRAEDLLSGDTGPATGADREYWSAQSKRVLTGLLHAAALGDLSIRDVQSWLADPDAAAPLITRLLRLSDQPAVAVDAAHFLTTNEKTRSSITSGIMPALCWLYDPNAVAAATGGGFDVDQLLRDRATVYLLGAEDAKTASLAAALTGHIAREARRIAGNLPGGRLDPPLTLVLDEAALICPVPLDNWTADMGGRNVTIHIAVQSRAQLRQRWGDTGSAAILNNAATVLIFGGAGDPDDLKAWSLLAGERLEKVESRDAAGKISSITTRRVPVLSPAEIANLPGGHVLIKRRGMPSAVGTVQMAWQRRDVRAAEREARRAERRLARAVVNDPEQIAEVGGRS
jgi:type IV secretory pathway TraG/TraD family ATPase VirD4